MLWKGRRESNNFEDRGSGGGRRIASNHAQEMKNILEKGDIEEAMNAASAIGMTTCKGKPRVKLSPIHLLTARRSNVCIGLNWASRRVI